MNLQEKGHLLIKDKTNINLRFVMGTMSRLVTTKVAKCNFPTFSYIVEKICTSQVTMRAPEHFHIQS